MTPTAALMRDAAIRHFPELAGARLTVLTAGWDCIALDVDDVLILKFPRDAAAEEALRREAALLSVIRPSVSIPVPDLQLCEGPPLFSRHTKLPGEHLLAPHYAALGIAAREELAAEMARFFAELHALDEDALRAAGAQPVTPWPPAEDILRRCLPLLPGRLRAVAEVAVAAWQDLPPDPLRTHFAFLDSHGWNLAFDHAAARLNGIYDFGDSGFAPLHQEFIAPSFVARDLTERIVKAYGAPTGRIPDTERIPLLTAVLRLAELAAHGDDPEHGPGLLRNAVEWLAGPGPWPGG